MRKTATPKRLSEEAEAFLLSSKEKIQGETNIAVFTKEEKFKIQACYQEVTGRPAPTNCNGLCPKALQILRNWLSWYETTQIPTIEEFIEPKDLNDYTKKELIEMYPGISPNLTKKKFIEKIQNG